MGKGARVKGYIKDLGSGQIREFLYNPSAYTTSRRVNYSEMIAPGSSYPKFQYVGGEAKTINFQLYLYGNKGEVRQYISFLNNFLTREDSNSKFTRPSMMLFAFGNYIKKCILTDFRESYFDFMEDDLAPRQVIIDLTLKVVA